MLLYGLLVPLTSSEAGSCRSIPSTRSFGMCSASLKMTAMTPSMRWRTEISWASLQHTSAPAQPTSETCQETCPVNAHYTVHDNSTSTHHSHMLPLLTPNATNEDPPFPPTYSSTLTSLIQRRSGRAWTGPLLLHCPSAQGRC